MERQKPIRAFREKKILKGTWKRRRIEYVSGEVIVRVKDEQLKKLKVEKESDQMRQKLLDELPKGSKIIRDFNRQGRIRIAVPDDVELLEIIQALEKRSLVKYAEPNIIHQTGQVGPLIPNEYLNLAALAANQWGLQSIRAPWAWNNTTGNTDVLIAVIDSGVSGPARAPEAVYRWYNFSSGDHFYCTDPLGELAHGGGYRYEGAPFTLFPSGAASTTPFYRWWNSSISDHFYTTDPNGELAPQSGYQLEGTIGNIATAPLPGTVALYRWWNSTSGDHFYTTDPNGELAPQSGYQYEGIAGYVNAAALGLLSHPDLVDENRSIFGNNYVHDDNFPIDDNGHGTHVAGIASADTNNNTGIAGVCWNCEVLIIKVFDQAGNGLNSDVADAIIEAVDFGTARGRRVVINYSGGSTQPSNTLADAVAYARQNNCLLVSIAHNDSNRAAGVIRRVRWPAAYSSTYDNVIAVGAIDNANNIANFSNRGPQLNVVAPGVNINSTVPNYIVPLNPAGALYRQMDGTSMAAPHVAGLAALMLSLDRRLSPRRVREIIEMTADGLGPAGKDSDFGYGRVNCERAIEVLLGGTIFRWWNSSIGDHFYTIDATGELAPNSGYVHEGAPFRLFPMNTQNTTPFFRWWNSSIGDHFYTTDPNGELAPQSGYQPEGTIGNIATAPLPGTVALYRWWNSSIGDHFYTTDPNGELAPQSGYQYEGIAGYVMLMG
ncbi:MAG: S8 family serine peptidase [Desulfobacteraceae bacterium]|nr:S8 family serine peptidase [Desulfobacteraceae bacterium]